MMGMLSNQEICVPHSGQNDRGAMTEMSLGIRYIQTFKKLPTSNPRSVAIGTAQSVQSGAKRPRVRINRAANKAFFAEHARDAFPAPCNQSCGKDRIFAQRSHRSGNFVGIVVDV